MLRFQKTVADLSEFDAGGEPALSLYLSTDPSGGAGSNLPAEIAGLGHAALAEAPASERTRLEAELRTVTEAALPLEPRPRGLAVFSCAARQFFRAVPLEARIAPSIHWGPHLDLRPLLAVVDGQASVLAVLLDKERARFFRAGPGSIRELEDLWDYVPNKHRQGGYAQANIQRDHEGHVLAHVRRVAAALERLDARESPRFILAGGPAEALAHLGEELASPLRERFHPVLRLPVIAPAAQVGDAVREAARTIAYAEQERLLDRLAEEAGRGRAVFGADEVLAGVNDLRVALLLLLHGLEVEGGECPTCGLLYRAPLPGACPGCRGPLEARPDLPSRMALAVLRQGGTVEEVQDGAAARLLGIGGMAARLRYATATGSGVAAPAAERPG